MIKNLRAKPLKDKETENNIYKLKKNTLKQINKENNSHIIHIYEENEDENLFIHSQFCDDSFAIIGNEFRLNFMENPKKVDLSYYSFIEDNKVIIYLYDIKKTFAGIDVIIHLIEQWKSSICDAKYCIDKLESYQISNICIGVITEENDIERRNIDLKPILHPDSISSAIPSFMISQHRADTLDRIAKAKLLSGFDEGKVTICGITYEYDIRIFNEKRHDMYFNNGVLKEHK